MPRPSSFTDKEKKFIWDNYEKLGPEAISMKINKNVKNVINTYHRMKNDYLETLNDEEIDELLGMK